MQVCKLGIIGSAFDSPDVKRAYTYTNQPDNVAASKLGQVLRKAAAQGAGDSIDGGLNLPHALADAGFGVFELEDVNDA